ncbi:MAG: hypothetical protein U0838_09985 [Chloroflexota bacterium]
MAGWPNRADPLAPNPCRWPYRHEEARVVATTRSRGQHRAAHVVEIDVGEQQRRPAAVGGLDLGAAGLHSRTCTSRSPTSRSGRPAATRARPAGSP